MMLANNNKKRTCCLLPNDHGVAIISALLVLMLLSFVAVVSTYTVLTEKRLNRSQAIFEQSFFLAESAVFEGLQKIENETAVEELLPAKLTGTSNNRDLLIAADTSEPKNDYENLDMDNDGDFDDADFSVRSEESAMNTDTRRLVVSMPIPPGSSLGVGGSRLYDYMGYGMTDANGGRVIIKVGFNKRF